MEVKVKLGTQLIELEGIIYLVTIESLGKKIKEIE